MPAPTTARTKTPWIVLLWLAVPPIATADDPERWPTTGLELRVDAPGSWIAGAERLVVVRVFEAPTALSLRPAGGALVEVAVAPRGADTVRASARADAQGTAVVAIPLPDEPGQVAVTVRARRAGAGLVRAQEITLEDPRVALVHTDRALYEPGEEVGIRVLVARRPDLAPRAAAPILVAVVGADGSTLHEEPLTTSRFGIATTALHLPPRVCTGS